jgi:hypothetical protein
MLLPSVASLQMINFRNTQWVLVVEKEVRRSPRQLFSSHSLTISGNISDPGRRPVRQTLSG